MRHTLRLVTALSLLTLASGAVLHADQIRQVIPLNAISNRQVVAMFSPQARDAAQDRAKFRGDFANRCVEKAVGLAERRSRNAEPRWYASAEVAAVPQEGPAGSEGALALPKDMDPPVALPTENSLLVRGTPEAVDEFREILAMIDRPQRMVNIECRLVDAPSRVVDQWGVDFSVRNGDVEISSRGNAPAEGLALRYGRANASVLLGISRSTSQGLLVTAPNATTTNMIPVVLSIGQTLPYWSAEVSYDYFGNRRVDYVANAVFIGVELYVKPRINADNSVTMEIVPTFSEGAGQVVGPNGVRIPIVQTLGTRTVVTVPDGGSLVIGGMDRSGDTLNTSFAGIAAQGRVQERSNPTLIVTPRVLPPATKPAEEVWH